MVADIKIEDKILNQHICSCSKRYIIENGKTTCCLMLENSGWFAAITFLNIRGRIPSCPYQIEQKSSVGIRQKNTLTFQTMKVKPDQYA